MYGEIYPDHEGNLEVSRYISPYIQTQVITQILSISRSNNPNIVLPWKAILEELRNMQSYKSNTKIVNFNIKIHNNSIFGSKVRAN